MIIIIVLFSQQAYYTIIVQGRGCFEADLRIFLTSNSIWFALSHIAFSLNSSSHLVQDFLALVNLGLPKEQWQITLVRFAPNCPSQNPIEDIWLQAKTWVRRFCALLPTFSHLKWMFEWFIRNTTFDFMSLQMYGVFSEIKS